MPREQGRGPRLAVSPSGYFGEPAREGRGDNRVPGRSKRHAIDEDRRALEVGDRPHSVSEPEHRREVHRHGGYAVSRATHREGEARPVSFF